jgi:DNA-binding transcriptional LysR family regulator
VRTTRRVDLTDAGTALLPEARKTLAAAEAARVGVGVVTGLLAGTVSIGTGKALHIEVANGLKRFSAEHPRIDVHLHQAGSIVLLEGVSDGTLDFAPLGLVDPVPEHIRDTVQVIEVHDEPMMVASQRHRFAEGKILRLVELAEERFVELGHDWAIRRLNDRAFSELGVSRRVAFETNDLGDLLEVIGRGLGVAVIPTSACRRARGVRFNPLDDSAPRWRVGVAVPRRRSPSPAARALFDMLVPGVEWPALS